MPVGLHPFARCWCSVPRPYSAPPIFSALGEMRSDAVQIALDAFQRDLSKLTTLLERTTSDRALAALGNIRAALLQEVALLEEATANSVGLSDLPHDSILQVLGFMNPHALACLALTNAVWAGHAKALMTSKDWGERTSFAVERESECSDSFQIRLDNETNLTIAVSCRMSTVDFGEFLTNVAAQMADVPPPTTFWDLMGMVAAKGLRRQEWTGEDFVIEVCYTLCPDKERGDLPSCVSTCPAVSKRGRRCCCGEDTLGRHKCVWEPTERQEYLREDACNVMGVTSPLVRAGVLSVAAILSGASVSLRPRAKAYYIACCFVAFGEGPEDIDDWDSWAREVAAMELSMPEFLELCRQLSNFDSVHTDVDLDGAPAMDYDAFRRSSSFLVPGKSYRQWALEQMAPRTCRNMCGFLEIWARVADFPGEWQRHDQALLAGFLEESPWYLKQVMPSDWCTWIPALPPSVVKRPPSAPQGRGARKNNKQREVVPEEQVEGRSSPEWPE